MFDVVINCGAYYAHNMTSSLKTNRKRGGFIASIVKGRGGSLFREKLIEGVGTHFIIIVDASKLVSRLGCMGINPVEVIPFGVLHMLGLIHGHFDGLPRLHARLRSVPTAAAKEEEDSEQSSVTNNGSYIVEMFFEDDIHGDLRDISDRLLQITSIVEQGMFLSYFSHVEEGGYAREKVQLTEGVSRHLYVTRTHFLGMHSSELERGLVHCI